MEEKATSLGNVTGTFVKDRITKKIQLTNVVNMPNGLLNITQILNKGWLMSGSKKEFFQKFHWSLLSFLRKRGMELAVKIIVRYINIIV